MVHITCIWRGVSRNFVIILLHSMVMMIPYQLSLVKICLLVSFNLVNKMAQLITGETLPVTNGYWLAGS